MTAPGRPALARGLLTLAVLAAMAASAYAVTPSDHVATGCLWWTATTVDRVVAGDRGCVRGYVAVGGSLAESRERSAYRLSYLLAEPDSAPQQAGCPFGPSDAVVIRYHATFDDGRTVLIVDACH